MTDIVTRRQIYDPDADDFFYEYVFWRPAGDGGVIWDDPRKRQITAYVPSDARYFVFIAARDFAGDIAPLVALYTDADNNFLPPSSAPFGEDYWTPYDLPLRGSLSVTDGPDLYTGVIEP